MESFEDDRLRLALGEIDAWRQIAFMTLCCERMVPNYERFASESGFGDPRLLREAVGAAWEWLETGRIRMELQQLRAAIEEKTPNTELFSSPFTSAALDAASAVSVLLDALEHPEAADPVGVASLARDSVDLYVQEIEDLDPQRPDLEGVIQEHPLMQAELMRQRDDLARLDSWSGARAEGAREFRALGMSRSGGSLSPSA